MNLLVRLATNALGLLSPTKEQRVATALQMASLARAKLLGAVTAPKAAAGATSTVDSAAMRAVTQELDRDTFLRLLVMQMQYQDPLEPVGNTEMIAQLAQFSALEQMNNLNRSMGLLSGNIDQLNFVSAASLLGRTVRGVDMSGNPIEGTVEGVHMQGSIIYLTVNGQIMSMAGVMAIGQPS